MFPSAHFASKSSPTIPSEGIIADSVAELCAGTPELAAPVRLA